MPARSPATLTRDVGRRVAELRAVQGWTQEAFAELAQVSVGYVRQVESGRENLTIASLAKLAELLGVDAAELLVPPISRETKRGRPSRSTQPTAADVLPAGPTILDVKTILGTEEELRGTLSLASRSAAAQQGGAEWISKVCRALAALLQEMGGREAPPVAGPTSEPATSIRRGTTGRAATRARRRSQL